MEELARADAGFVKPRRSGLAMGRAEVNQAED